MKASAQQLYKELECELKTCNLDPILSVEYVKTLEKEFLPEMEYKCLHNEECNIANCQSRCSREYWLEHGLLTQILMENFAHKYEKDIELYGMVGRLHDIDYLKNPHDIKFHQNKDVHPVPLAQRMCCDNVHPIIVMAILEHAPYVGYNRNPSSCLSAALSACEDLATLLSVTDIDEALNKLSKEACELADSLTGKVKTLIDRNVKGPKQLRVLNSPDKFINKPLLKAITGSNFLFDV